MQCQLADEITGPEYHWAMTGAMLSLGTWLVPITPLICPKRTSVFTFVGSAVMPSRVSWLSPPLDGCIPSWFAR